MSNKLRIARIRAGLSQEEIAKKAYIARSTYTRIESGERKPSLNSAIGISQALGVKIEDIFLPSDVIN